MTINVPKDLKYITGIDVSSDEDGLAALAGVWREVAQGLAALAVRLRAAVNVANANYAGRGQSKFAAAIGPFVEVMPNTEELFGEIADALEQYSFQVERMKIMAITTLAELAAELAWALANIPFTLGASFIQWLARVAASRVLWQQFVLRVLIWLLENVIKAAAVQVALQLFMDTVVQLAMLAKHPGKYKWDVNSTVQAVYGGLMGAAVALPIGALMHHVIAPILFKAMRFTFGALARAGGQLLSTAFVQRLGAVAADVAQQFEGDVGRVPAPDLAKQMSKTAMQKLAPHLGEHGWAHFIEETISEVLTEGLVEVIVPIPLAAAQGQPVSASLTDFTSGAFSGVFEPGGKAARMAWAQIHPPNLHLELGELGELTEPLLSHENSLAELDSLTDSSLYSIPSASTSTASLTTPPPYTPSTPSTSTNSPDTTVSADPPLYSMPTASASTVSLPPPYSPTTPSSAPTPPSGRPSSPIGSSLLSSSPSTSSPTSSSTVADPWFEPLTTPPASPAPAPAATGTPVTATATATASTGSAAPLSPTASNTSPLSGTSQAPTSPTPGSATEGLAASTSSVTTTPSPATSMVAGGPVVGPTTPDGPVLTLTIDEAGDTRFVLPDGRSMDIDELVPELAWLGPGTVQVRGAGGQRRVAHYARQLARQSGQPIIGPVRQTGSGDWQPMIFTPNGGRPTPIPDTTPEPTATPTTPDLAAVGVPATPDLSATGGPITQPTPITQPAAAGPEPTGGLTHLPPPPAARGARPPNGAAPGHPTNGHHPGSATTTGGNSTTDHAGAATTPTPSDAAAGPAVTGAVSAATPGSIVDAPRPLSAYQVVRLGGDAEQTRALSDAMSHVAPIPGHRMLMVPGVQVGDTLMARIGDRYLTAAEVVNESRRQGLADLPTVLVMCHGAEELQGQVAFVQEYSNELGQDAFATDKFACVSSPTGRVFAAAAMGYTEDGRPILALPEPGKPSNANFYRFSPGQNAPVEQLGSDIHESMGLPVKAIRRGETLIHFGDAARSSTPRRSRTIHVPSTEPSNRSGRHGPPGHSRGTSMHGSSSGSRRQFTLRRPHESTDHLGLTAAAVESAIEAVGEVRQRLDTETKKLTAYRTEEAETKARIEELADELPVGGSREAAAQKAAELRQAHEKSKQHKKDIEDAVEKARVAFEKSSGLLTEAAAKHTAATDTWSKANQAHTTIASELEDARKDAGSPAHDEALVDGLESELANRKEKLDEAVAAEARTRLAEAKASDQLESDKAKYTKSIENLRTTLGEPDTSFDDWFAAESVTTKFRALEIMQGSLSMAEEKVAQQQKLVQEVQANLDKAVQRQKETYSKLEDMTGAADRLITEALSLTNALARAELSNSDRMAALENLAVAQAQLQSIQYGNVDPITLASVLGDVRSTFDTLRETAGLEAWSAGSKEATETARRVELLFNQLNLAPLSEVEYNERLDELSELAERFADAESVAARRQVSEEIDEFAEGLANDQQLVPESAAVGAMMAGVKATVNAAAERHAEFTAQFEFARAQRTSMLTTTYRNNLLRSGIFPRERVVAYDGNCLPASVIEQFRGQLRDALGGAEPTVRRLRDEAANYLQDMLANRPDDVRVFIPRPDGYNDADYEALQRRYVRNIRAMGRYNNDAGDLFLWLLTERFNLRVTVLGPRHAVDMGPIGGHRGYLYHTGNHYMPVRSGGQPTQSAVSLSAPPRGSGLGDISLGDMSEIASAFYQVALGVETSAAIDALPARDRQHFVEQRNTIIQDFSRLQSNPDNIQPTLRQLDAMRKLLNDVHERLGEPERELGSMLRRSLTSTGKQPMRQWTMRLPEPKPTSKSVPTTTPLSPVLEPSPSTSSTTPTPEPPISSVPSTPMPKTDPSKSPVPPAVTPTEPEPESSPLSPSTSPSPLTPVPSILSTEPESSQLPPLSPFSPSTSRSKLSPASLLSPVSPQRRKRRTMFSRPSLPTVPEGVPLSPLGPSSQRSAPLSSSSSPGSRSRWQTLRSLLSPTPTSPLSSTPTSPLSPAPFAPAPTGPSTVTAPSTGPSEEPGRIRDLLPVFEGYASRYPALEGRLATLQDAIKNAQDRGHLPVKDASELLVDPTPQQLNEWRRDSKNRAWEAENAAKGQLTDDARIDYRLRAVMLREFPEWSGAFGLTGGDTAHDHYHPLVWAVVNENAGTPTVDHMAQLRSYARVLDAAGEPLTVERLRDHALFVQRRAELIRRPLESYPGKTRPLLQLDPATLRGAAALQTWQASVELASVYHELGSGAAVNPANVQATETAISAARQARVRGRESLTSPVTPAEVRTLVQDALGEPHVDFEQVRRFDDSHRSVARRDMLPRPLRHRMRRQAMKSSGGPDTPQLRANEGTAIQATLEPGNELTAQDIDELVRVRRESWDRDNPRYTDLQTYGPMAKALLGVPGEVQPAHVHELARIVRDTKNESGLRWQRLNADGIQRALVKSTINSDDWNAPDPTRPIPQRPVARLNGVEVDPNNARLVNGFHVVKEDPSEAVADWLNGIVPQKSGTDNFTSDGIKKVFGSSFTQMLDDGYTLDVPGYSVTVWTIPAEAPTYAYTQAEGKAENRGFGLTEPLTSSSEASGGYADAGVAVKVEDPTKAAKATVTATVGGVWTKGRSKLAGLLLGMYNWVRMKEPGGETRFPAVIVARVVDEGTGRWRDYQLDGTHRIALLIAGDQMPITEAQRQEAEAAKKSSGVVPEVAATTAEPIIIDRPVSLDFDHYVPRVDLSSQILTAIHQQISTEEWQFWQRDLRKHFYQGGVKKAVRDILRPAAHQTYQNTFKFSKTRGGRTLNVSVTAPPAGKPNITSSVAVGKPSGPEARFDQIDAVYGRSRKTSVATKSGRLTLSLSGRLLYVFTKKGTGRGTRATNLSFAEETKSWTTRSKRKVGDIQLAVLGVNCVVTVDHQRSPEAAAESSAAEITGSVHILAKSDDLVTHKLVADPLSPDQRAARDNKRATATRPDNNRRRLAIPGVGPIVETLDDYGDMSGLYNNMAGQLVDQNLLPPEAAPKDHGHTPWQILQGLSRTGSDLNKSGALHQNWRTLVETVFSRQLRPRFDDLTGGRGDYPGAVFTLHRQDGTKVILGLSLMLGNSQHQGTHDPQIQLGHTSFGTVDQSRNVSYQLDGTAQTGLNFDEFIDVTPTLATGKNGTRIRTTIVGQSDTSLVAGDYDAQKRDSDRYDVTGQWRYWLMGPQAGRQPVTAPAPVVSSVPEHAPVPGESLFEPPVPEHSPALGESLFEPPVPEHSPAPGESPIPGMELLADVTVDTKISVWQPNDLAVLSTDATPAPLENVSGKGRSALSGLRQWVVLTAGGVDQIRRALLDWSGGIAKNGQVAPVTELEILDGVTQTAINCGAMRALTTAHPLVIGDKSVAWYATPVGTPRLLKLVEPYTQTMGETQKGVVGGSSQAGREGTLTQGGLSAGLSADHTHYELTGHELLERMTNTAGDYTGNFLDGINQREPWCLTESMVSYTLELPDGQTKDVTDKIITIARWRDILKSPDQFDDPHHLLPQMEARREVQLRDQRDGLIKKGKPLPEPEPEQGNLSTMVDPPRTLQDGFPWSGAWPLVTRGGDLGYEPLLNQLRNAAADLGGPELRVLVAPFVGAMLTRMSMARDGGVPQTFQLADGRQFDLVISAKPACPSRDADPYSDEGLKLYTRGNQTKNIDGRTSEGTRDVTTLTAPAIKEIVTIGGTSQIDQSTVESYGWGSTLMRLDGTRQVQGTGFTQKVEFTWALAERKQGVSGAAKTTKDAVTGLLGTPAPRKQTGTALVDLPVSMPMGACLPRGAGRQTYEFSLSNQLPPGTRVEGLFGIEPIFDALKNAKVGRSDDAWTLNDVPRRANNESFLKHLGAMLSGGDSFDSISSKGECLEFGKNGLDVKARFTDVRHVYVIPSAEFEGYDHTFLADYNNESDQSSKNAGVTVSAPIPVAPGVYVGPSGSGGLTSSDSTTTYRNARDEDRNWERRNSRIVGVYTGVEYNIRANSWSGQRTLRAFGSTLLLMSERDAQRMGVPADVIKAAPSMDAYAKWLNANKSALELNGEQLAVVNAFNVFMAAYYEEVRKQTGRVNRRMLMMHELDALLHDLDVDDLDDLDLV